MIGTAGIAILFAISVGGLLYTLLYTKISGGARADQRVRDIATAEVTERSARAKLDAGTSRRQQIEESLKQLEARRRNVKNPPLSVRIQQAGLKWNKKQYWMISAGAGVGAGATAFMFGANPWIALGVVFVAGFGVPRWALAYLKKRREGKFIDELPNAVDVIVRGVKAGLPLSDCIRIIVTETQEPVKAEFRQISESQAVGVPLPDAASKLYDRVPLAEANFFGIVITIQQKAGGSLSDALGNLSRVLRERKKMKAKIQAMSMEAKASAAIIASLPIAVMLLVYLTSPNYIELLWTHPTGRVMLLCSAVWMSMGVLVMRRMINFDF
jgi:tight adherence protein B